MSGLIQDLRYALRQLRKSPMFATVALLTLAVGIGATSAMFSAAGSVLLRPLPYRDPDRLVFLCRDFAKSQAKDVLFSNDDFIDLQGATGAAFSDMAGVFTSLAFVPREDGGAEQISKAQVTANFFRLLGARIELGRDFTAEDERPQPRMAEGPIPIGTAAILSYEYWQQRYGGNAAILGHEMLSYGQRGPRIIGVLAPGFKLFLPQNASTGEPPDVLIANNVGYDPAARNLITLHVIGRLKPRVMLQQAREQVSAVAAALRRDFPDWYGRDGLNIRVEPMLPYLVSQIRPTMLALSAAVMFLFVIACANVANLLLVRASIRERELAVRAALGGTWSRLARQMLTEGILLSLFAGLLGIALAGIAIRFLLALAPSNLPRITAMAGGWHLPLFAAAAGASSVLLFGVLPALRAASPDIIRILHAGAHMASSGRGRLLRNSVVVVEVALSFVLLIGSGLMFRSLSNLYHIYPGYDPHHVLTFVLGRNWPLSGQAGRVELLNQVQSRLRGVPGVENVTASISFPLVAGSPPPVEVSTRQGSTDPAGSISADFRGVLPGYFDALRTPVLSGRTFTDDDNARGRNVAIIDQLLFAKAFPNESAIGKRLFLPFGNPPWVEVVGIVAHQRADSLTESGRAQIYFPDNFGGIGVSRYWAMRVAGDPMLYVSAVREAVAGADKQFVMSKLQPMTALMDRTQADTRFSFALITVFAGIAVLLAGVGLYGVLSTTVRQRTREIGLRMALGASPTEVLKEVVRHGLLLSAIGIVAGVLAALALTRAMAAMLVGIQPTDPSTLVGTTIFFFGIASLASWLAARRAAKVDPMVALRYE